MTATVLRHQLAAARAIGDHAAELILSGRLHSCQSPDCRRAPEPGYARCPSCTVRLLTGHIVKRERRKVQRASMARAS